MREKNMRGLLVVGLILIVAGIVSLAVNVIPVHHQEQVAKIGPLTATADKETDYVIPPYAGIIAIVIGGGLVFAGMRRT
jgi:hypothetical protein